MYRVIGSIGRVSAAACLAVSMLAQADEPVTVSPQDAESINIGTTVMDLGALTGMDALVRNVSDKQVVYVGESHTRYDHHINQLAIIKGLYQYHPDLVIGLEFFQQPFQKYLDRYIAGDISEGEMLRETEYFDRWSYDYRLYRPILRFAREHKIPLIALNIPREITGKVARGGLSSLSEAERRQVPADLERGNAKYLARLKAVFQQHPEVEERNFDNFVETQLTWDEGMAERAARHFKHNPKGHMVLLAGVGHLMYGDGIPDRLARRVPASSAIVLNGIDAGVDRTIGDYLLLSDERKLTRTGLMGVMLESTKSGVEVKEHVDDSAAKEAGMKKGDRIVRIGDFPIKTYSDVRIAMLDLYPGNRVQVEVKRNTLFIGDETFTFDLTLK